MSSGEQNLSIPHHQGLDGLHRVQIVGKVKESANRFEVNVHTSTGEVLLHFNARFDENCVVRNSTKEGHKWQEEDRSGGMPLHPGNPFTLELIGSDQDEKILCLVNGVQFCEFQARDPLSSANVLEINGDVHLEVVSVSQAQGGRGGRDVPTGELGDTVRLEPEPVEPEPTPVHHPEPDPEPVQPTPAHHQEDIVHPAPVQPEPTPTRHEEPIQPEPTPPHSDGTLSVPYHGPLQEFVRTNRLRIVGAPKVGGQRFQVNMKAANGEVLFQFNPRLDQNCVVRNATQGQVWPYELEEREGGPCPFQPGKQFALDFLVHGNIIRCFVDGNEYCRFNTRHDLTQVHTLEVVGDVDMHQVLIA